MSEKHIHSERCGQSGHDCQGAEARLNAAGISKDQAIRYIQQLGDAIVAAVEVGEDEGASGGLLYNAMLTKIPNMTSQWFESVMTTLVGLGRLSKRGQKYYAGRWR